MKLDVYVYIQDHSTVSATALHLMGSLIYHQHKTKLSCVSHIKFCVL